MPAPLYTIIIPAPHFDEARGALAALPAELLRTGEAEVIVATGNNPSAQRNAAAAQAHGEILIFLDSDSQVKADYFAKLSAAFTPDLNVMGGPVLLKEPASPLAQTFQTLLSHPLLVGPISSRYHSRGQLRACRDDELILCNFVIRAEAWKVVGSFLTSLYPNEENEWMERAQRAGYRLCHHPHLIVHRPQRETMGDFFLMLLRYGEGRTKQSWQSRTFQPARQAPLLLGLAGLLAFFLFPGLTFALGLCVWFFLGWLVARSSPGHLTRPLILLAGSVPLFYATGQLIGWCKVVGGIKRENIAPTQLYQGNGLPLRH